MSWNDLFRQIKEKGFLKAFIKDLSDNVGLLFLCIAIAGCFYYVGADRICRGHGGTISGEGFLGVNFKCYEFKMPELYAKYKGMPDISDFNFSIKLKNDTTGHYNSLETE